MKWCSCIEWEIAAPQLGAQQRAGSTIGWHVDIMMPFCPWCGSDLEDV
jgi:hypothetical protein